MIDVSLKDFTNTTDEEGNTVLAHSSGSSIVFRADGNIDIYAARNLRLNAGFKTLIMSDEAELDG